MEEKHIQSQKSQKRYKISNLSNTPLKSMLRPSNINSNLKTDKRSPMDNNHDKEYYFQNFNVNNIYNQSPSELINRNLFGDSTLSVKNNLALDSSYKPIIHKKINFDNVGISDYSCLNQELDKFLPNSGLKRTHQNLINSNIGEFNPNNTNSSYYSNFSPYLPQHYESHHLVNQNPNNSNLSQNSNIQQHYIPAVPHCTDTHHYPINNNLSNVLSYHHNHSSVQSNLMPNNPYNPNHSNISVNNNNKNPHNVNNNYLFHYSPMNFDGQNLTSNKTSSINSFAEHREREKERNNKTLTSHRDFNDLSLREYSNLRNSSSIHTITNLMNLSHSKKIELTSQLEDYQRSKTVFCKCKKSKCVKNYCECFAKKERCVGCNCEDCENLPIENPEKAAASSGVKSKKVQSFNSNEELQDINNMTSKFSKQNSNFHSHKNLHHVQGNTALTTLNRQMKHINLNTNKTNQNQSTTNIKGTIINSTNPIYTADRHFPSGFMRTSTGTKRNLLKELNEVEVNQLTQQKQLRKKSTSSNIALEKPIDAIREESKEEINLNNSEYLAGYNSLMNTSIKDIDAKRSPLDLTENKKDIFMGCNCAKSNCRKRYCECYKAGLACTDLCRCVECFNEFNIIRKLDKKLHTEVSQLCKFQVEQISIEISDRKIDIQTHNYYPQNPFVSSVINKDGCFIMVNKIVMKLYEITNIEEVMSKLGINIGPSTHLNLARINNNSNCYSNDKEVVNTDDFAIRTGEFKRASKSIKSNSIGGSFGVNADRESNVKSFNFVDNSFKSSNIGRSKSKSKSNTKDLSKESRLLNTPNTFMKKKRIAQFSEFSNKYKSMASTEYMNKEQRTTVTNSSRKKKRVTQKSARKAVSKKLKLQNEEDN